MLTGRLGRSAGSFPSLRRYLRRRGLRAVIPSTSNQPRQRGFDRAAYRALAGRRRRGMVQPLHPQDRLELV
jgi:hypothetical protein